jgi:hypothetical protein
MIDAELPTDLLTLLIPDAMPQAITWVKLTQALPVPDVSVLIVTDGVGPTYDAAVYRGRDAGGEHRWIVTDVSIEHSSIMAWAYIPEPEWLK